MKTDPMMPRLRAALVGWTILANWGATAPGQDGATSAAPSAAAKRKVLVELYTSQGCNSCPPAADLLGRFPALGLGPDRVVALNFHVDYFNKPWADPFSDPSYSDRELSYNGVLRRDDLYFTPMMMVDGRVPLLGSNRDKALDAIRQARAARPEVDLAARLDGKGPGRELAVRITPHATVAGRDVLVGAALTQDRVVTTVPRGENAGRTLVENHVVRRFDHRMLRLKAGEPTSLNFPFELPSHEPEAQFRVAVFVQDRLLGRVFQAESLAWSEPTATPPVPITGREASR